MRKVLLALVCLLTLNCDVSTISTDHSAIVSRERILFNMGCDASFVAPHKLVTCYQGIPDKSFYPNVCSDIVAFYQKEKSIVDQCIQNKKVVTLWVEIEMDSEFPGIKKETIDNWIILTKATIDFLKNSGNFNNDSLSLSVSKISDYTDELKNQLDIFNRSDEAKTNKLGNQSRERIQKIIGSSIAAEQKELAETRANINEINPILDNYELQVNQQKDAYLTVIKAYTDLKNTGHTIAYTLRQKATEASGITDYNKLAEIKMSAIEINQSEFQKMDDLIFQIKSLRRIMGIIQNEYEQRIGPYKNWMIEKKFKVPDLLSVAIESLDNMIVYLDSRQQFTGAATNKLIRGIEDRTKALIIAKADASTRNTLIQAAYQTRATDFITLINNKITSLWQIPEKSKRLHLSYLRPKYEKCASLLAYEGMCQTVIDAQTSWMREGCILMQVEFSKIKNYMQDGLPVEIEFNVNALRAAEVDPAYLARITELTAQNNLAEATRLHDIAVMTTEATNEATY